MFSHWSIKSLWYPSLLTLRRRRVAVAEEEGPRSTAAVEPATKDSIVITAWTLTTRSCRKLRRLIRHYLPSDLKWQSVELCWVPIDRRCVLVEQQHGHHRASRKRRRSAARLSGYEEELEATESHLLSSTPQLQFAGRHRRKPPKALSSRESAVHPRRAARSHSGEQQKKKEDGALRVLGKGNNGVVYEVTLQGLGPVAAKLVNASSEHVQREVATLRAARDVHCTGVVQLVDLLQLDHGQRSLLLLEKLGRDVWYLTDRQRLYPDEIAAIGVAMLDGLHALHHDCQRLHKSVKPENACFTLPPFASHGADYEGPLIKLIDFGRSVPLCPVTQQDNETAPEAEHTSSSELPVEERYTGWWFSRAAMLGLRQGREDDLLSVLYSVGFLLDDAQSSQSSSTVPSTAHSLDRSDVVECEQDTDDGASSATNRETKEDVLSFLDHRHKLVDFIDECLLPPDCHTLRPIARLTSETSKPPVCIPTVAGAI